MLRHSLLFPPPMNFGGGTSAPAQPAYAPGRSGLTSGIRTLTTGTSGNKNASSTSLGLLSGTIERLDLTFEVGLGAARVYCMDLFVGASKVVTDLPIAPSTGNYPRKTLDLHVASGSEIKFNAAANANTQTFNAIAFGYSADVAQPITVIEPIGPVGSGATYPATTGTLVKVPNGSATSGWTCINPSAATAHAYSRLFPFCHGYNDLTGRTATTGRLEIGYADDDAGSTNFVDLGVQLLIGQAATLIYTCNYDSIPVAIPSGKYLFANVTLLTNANKTTGTVTDGDPFNVQIHGGRT